MRRQGAGGTMNVRASNFDRAICPEYRRYELRYRRGGAERRPCRPLPRGLDMNCRPLPSAVLHTARSLLAVVLVYVTVASAVPRAAVSATGHTTADCCAGMSAAEMGSSCPLHRLKQSPQTPPAGSDPMCRTVGVMPQPHLRPKRTAAGYAVDKETHRFPDQRRVFASHNQTKAADSVAAAVSPPCSSDCCQRAGSLMPTIGQRDNAALSGKLHPRAPAASIDKQISDILFSHTSQVRRQCPPRAPPASLTSTLA